MMKKHWKKSLALGLSVIIGAGAFFGFPSSVPVSYGAEQAATVTATTLNVRSGPGTGNSVVGRLTYGTGVTILGQTTGSDGAVWYQIRFTGSGGAQSTGYVSGAYLSTASAYSQDSDFEAYLTAQGFPESYRPALRQLHSLYPQWVFTAFNTGLDWNTVIENESLVGRNLVSSSSISSWKSTADGAYDWGTSTWPGFDGSSWVAASEDIIRYYMDPRNFLNETYIFQFLLQSYDSAVHTREGLAALVQGTFLEGIVPVSDSYAGVTVNNGTAQTSPGSGSEGGTVVSPGESQAESSQSVQSGQGPGGTGESSSSSGSPEISIGTAPGMNVSDRGDSLSISQNQVQKVAATTIIRVNPDGSTSTSNSSSPGQSSGSSGVSSSGSGRSAYYVDILMEAARQSGVSPYVLAAMILQEQNTDGSGSSISGSSGYYNYYNFEAYASNGMSAVERGLWYASQSGGYLRPWNSIDKAIIGGACQYGQNYVQAGQNTFYLKKFNVQGSSLYLHQFMTNIQGAASEGSKMAEAYSSNMRQSALQFSIPVYQNMPADPCVLPSVDGSPNNKLSSISVDGFAITPSFNRDTSVYDVTVNTSVNSVVIQASAIDSTAQISGTGTISLNGDLTEVMIQVTAQNGAVREYMVRITRSASGPVAESTPGGTSQSGQTAGPGGSAEGPGASSPGAPGTSSGGSGEIIGPGGSNVTIVG